VVEWFQQRRNADQRRNITFQETAIRHRNDSGQRCWVLKPPAFQLCAQDLWSDEHFEDILVMLNFRVMAKMDARARKQEMWDSDL
jgi:hypothetical protein